jgi:membrane-bound lytic murein transglycosylase D
MLFAYPVTLCAQEEADVPVPVAMTYPLDSLLNEWNAKTYLTPSADCDPNAGNPSYPDSVYIDRLARIPSVMELAYNDVVRKFIDAYTGKLRGQVSFMLSACNFYMPIFEEALDAYNLPLELKYLPIIESALNPSAVSRAGASGLWQFMLRTGKLYGLEVNSLVDERRDPLKSSWAAARYLRDLYTIYGDWNLVIAAYNCGPGNVNKAIRYADGSTDYWKMYNHLPRETRGYVPAFIAANYIMTYYCKHNICPMETGIPVATDTVHVRKNLHFRQISELCGISMEELKSLNPQYKREIIPGETSEQTLRLPTVAMSAFIDRRDTIYDYHRDELFRNRRVVAVPEARSTRARRSTVGSGALSYHKIRNGETLGSIARNYGVTVRQLQDWNGMSNTRITAGKRLKIYR